MYDRWYRDPRICLLPAILIALLAATAAAAAQEAGWRVLLIGLAAFALVWWSWFAIQGLGWLWQRPVRQDVLLALAMQRNQDRFNQAAWTRIDRDGTALRLLLAERALIPIEAELVYQADLVERFDAVRATLPAFASAATQWYATAAQGHPTLSATLPEPTAAALRQAAAMLHDTVLTGEEREAAIRYLAIRQRLMADRLTIEEERTAALPLLTGRSPTPPAPTPPVPPEPTALT